MNLEAYGPTTAKTTKIGLGGAFLTSSSFADGVATVKRALELGVRYFDTWPKVRIGEIRPARGTFLVDSIAYFS